MLRAPAIRKRLKYRDRRRDAADFKADIVSDSAWIHLGRVICGVHLLAGFDACGITASLA